MIGLLNIGSLVLGLLAWILPGVNLIQHNKTKNKNWVALSVISISACAIALSLQMFYSYHLVKVEDWSALMDTTGAVVFAATILLIVTIILNSITLIIYRNKVVR